MKLFGIGEHFTEGEIIFFMKKLNLQQVLCLNDEKIFIQHKELGNWTDHADGVYTLFDMNCLYLENSDVWLDCDRYGQDWIAFKIEPENSE